ncbi:MAG: hypothetical protein RLY43_79 [Bacteroidota bacterium]
MMVSVVIPMFNSQNSINRCINSVFKQTYKGLIEIIVVNDGSTDSSKYIVEQIIKSNLSNNCSLKLVNQDNRGVSAARNTGLKLVTGQFIALLDSDDEWLPNKLKDQLDIMFKDDNIDFLGGLIGKTYKGQRLLEIPLYKLFFKNYFQPSTVIFKKEVLSLVGYFDESQNYAEEGNYFMRVAKNFRCVLLNEKVVLYGQDKLAFGISGLSANLKEMEKGELKNLRFAYKEDYMNAFIFYFAIFYSLCKYLRRIMIIKFIN